MAGARSSISFEMKIEVEIHLTLLNINLPNQRDLPGGSGQCNC